MRKESIERQGLVDYNVQVFQNALEKVFEMRGGWGSDMDISKVIKQALCAFKLLSELCVGKDDIES